MDSEYITIKSSDEIAKMRVAGQATAKALRKAGSLIRPGISTEEIDDAVAGYIASLGARAAALGYKGFPKSICTSINEVVCHGIPSKKHVLKDGDIINVDIALIIDGYHGDASRMFTVGQVSERARALIDCTNECKDTAISLVRPGLRLRELGACIQRIAHSKGFSVVREYIGHGIGVNFHEPPEVFHYANPGPTIRLRPGMTFTVEPMINMGTHETVLDKKDGWTVRTRDGKFSAQAEDTVLVTGTGYEVLTA